MKLSKDQREAVEAMARGGAKGLLERGSLVVAFTVPARPVPWKAPTVTRSGVSFKDKRLLAWQAEVNLRARAAMAGRDAYANPVELEMCFFLTPKPGSPPDLSNLVKGTEDSLQGVVIDNDRRVFRQVATRSIGDRDGVDIRVIAG